VSCPDVPVVSRRSKAAAMSVHQSPPEEHKMTPNRALRSVSWTSWKPQVLSLVT